MARFSATNRSVAVVPVDRAAVWAVLTDPVLLPRLTPLLQRIDVDAHDEDLWTWQLVGISVLGVGVGGRFTERMTFDPMRSISYVHEPPPGVVEHTAAEGHYELTGADGGTHLEIELTLTVDLPLSRLAAPAVTPVISATMQRTGDRFGVNLLRHLGVTDPDRARRR